MNDDWTEAGTLTDAAGKRLTVSHAGGYVRIAVVSPAGIVLAGIVLDGQMRDAFDPAYLEASRHAEARQAGATP